MSLYLKSAYHKQNSIHFHCIRGWTQKSREIFISKRGQIKPKATVWLHSTTDKWEYLHQLTNLYMTPQVFWLPFWVKESAGVVCGWSTNMQTPGSWQQATPFKTTLLRFSIARWVRAAAGPQQSRQCFLCEVVELLAYQQTNAGICFLRWIKHSLRTNQTMQQEITACYMAKKVEHLLWDTVTVSASQDGIWMTKINRDK